MTIVWSEEAKSDYEYNIDFLLQNWSLKEAQVFVDEVDLVLRMIAKMPTMFPLSDYKDIRKCIVCKQISLLYRVSGNSIFILRFWNNYQKEINI